MLTVARGVTAVAMIMCIGLVSGVSSSNAEDRKTAYEWKTDPWIRWRSAIEVDHPLAGKVWSVRDQKLTTIDRIRKEVLLPPFVFIGGNLANPDHYRISAWLIKSALQKKTVKSRNSFLRRLYVGWLLRGDERKLFDYDQARQKKVLATGADLLKKRDLKTVPENFEMIARTIFMAAMQEHAAIAASELRHILNLPDAIRSNWNMRVPIIEAVYLTDFHMLYASQPTDAQVARYVARKISNRPPRFNRWEKKKLTVPLPAKVEMDLLAELQSERCEKATPQTADALLNAQRFKDGSAAFNMTESWLPKSRRTGADRQPNDSDYAIVFSGKNSRIRSDRGVPWYLGKMVDDAKILKISIIETRKNQLQAHLYVPRDSDGAPVVDYLVFTPPFQSPPERCE